MSSFQKRLASLTIRNEEWKKQRGEIVPKVVDDESRPIVEEAYLASLRQVHNKTANTRLGPHRYCAQLELAFRDKNGYYHMTIRQDYINSIYLNEKFLFETEALLIPFAVRVGNGMNIAQKLDVMVKIHKFSKAEVQLSSVAAIDYGVVYLMEFQFGKGLTLPDERVLIANVHNKFVATRFLTPMVASIFNSPIGQVPRVPKMPLKYDFLKHPYSLAYCCGPPGAGKTWDIISVAMTCYGKGVSCFVFSETNKLVQETMSRLEKKKTPYHYLKSGDTDLKFIPKYGRDLTQDYVSKKLTKGNDIEMTSNLAQKILDYSTIIVSTKNKLISPLFFRRHLRVEVLIADESPLMTAQSMIAVLALNPEVLLLYGDHNQGEPFYDNKVQDYNDRDEIVDDEEVFSPEFEVKLARPVMANSLITLFKLVNSEYHSYVRKKTRMPEPVNTDFLSFFYENVSGKTLADSDLMNLGPKVTFLSDYTNRDPKSVKGTKSMFDASVIGDGIKLLTTVDYFWITPYLGQSDLLKSQKGIDPAKVLTLAPVQGLEADLVIIDFVTKTPTDFLTNNNMLTAFSRFRKNLVFLTNFKINAGWCSKPFHYNDHLTIWGNYMEFCGCLDGPYFSKVRPKDVNNNHALKWVFWFGLLERVQFLQGGLTYGIGTTIFGQLGTAMLKAVTLSRDFYNALMAVPVAGKYFASLLQIYTKFGYVPFSTYRVGENLVFVCSFTAKSYSAPKIGSLIELVKEHFLSWLASD